MLTERVKTPEIQGDIMIVKDKNKVVFNKDFLQDFGAKSPSKKKELR